MDKLLSVLIAAAAILLASGNAFSQSSAENRAEFEKRVFYPQGIDNFGMDQKRFSALSESSKKRIEQCRDVLMNYLKALNAKKDIRPYVSEDSLKKLSASEILAYESSLIAAGVYDFDISGNTGLIKLKFFVLAHTEGDFVVSEKEALLTPRRGRYRVLDIKNHEAE